MVPRKIAQKIYDLLDEQKFDEARKVIQKGIEAQKEKSTRNSILKIIDYYGFLIDLGCESSNESDLKVAIAFLEEYEDKIANYVNKQSYYYNLANAKHGLSSIHIQKQNGVPSLKFVSEYLQAPINYYWLSYKNLDENDNNDLRNEVLTNLANSLNKTGRIIECIQLLDTILRNNPSFPQALISRADAIDYSSMVTNCAYTGSLFFEIYKSYDYGISTNKLPPLILERAIVKRNITEKIIESMGFKVTDLDEEQILTQKEFNELSHYRKFCLTNFLSLNEHAIYCHCLNSAKDNLTIGNHYAKFKGKIVPQLELLLNRIKSEFSFGR